MYFSLWETSPENFFLGIIIMEDNGDNSLYWVLTVVCTSCTKCFHASYSFNSHKTNRYNCYLHLTDEQMKFREVKQCTHNHIVCQQWNEDWAYLSRVHKARGLNHHSVLLALCDLIEGGGIGHEWTAGGLGFGFSDIILYFTAFQCICISSQSKALVFPDGWERMWQPQILFPPCVDFRMDCKAFACLDHHVQHMPCKQHSLRSPLNFPNLVSSGFQLDFVWDPSFTTFSLILLCLEVLLCMISIPLNLLKFVLQMAVYHLDSSF